jgi:hypothetical protein
VLKRRSLIGPGSNLKRCPSTTLNVRGAEPGEILPWMLLESPIIVANDSIWHVSIIEFWIGKTGLFEATLRAVEPTAVFSVADTTRRVAAVNTGRIILGAEERMLFQMLFHWIKGMVSPSVNGMSLIRGAQAPSGWTAPRDGKGFICAAFSGVSRWTQDHG